MRHLLPALGILPAAAPGDRFLPHGFCFLWNRPLLWTHVVSDVLIGVCYVVIAATLLRFVLRARQELPFRQLFVAFGAFIVACGATHFLEVVTFWTPVYWWLGAAKVVTLIASGTTALALPGLMPQAHALLRDAHGARAREVAAARAEGLATRNAELAELNGNLLTQALALEAANDALQRQAHELAQSVARREAGDASLHVLHTAVSKLHDIVIITSARPIDDPDGPRIVFVNDAFERHTGWTREEVLGRTPRILQGRDTDRAALDRIRAAMVAWQPIREELCNYRKDGTPFWVEMEIVPVGDENGWYTHWIAVQRDVTERRRLEEQLRQAQKMEAIGQLAGGIAHDFNNLLTAIHGNLTFAIDALPRQSAARADIDEARHAADRAAGLTRQLLAFSRNTVFAPQVIDLSASLHDVEQLLRRVIGEQIRLETHLTAPGGCVRLHAGQLEQIVMNLAVNARDAMPDGGRITLAVRAVSAAELRDRLPRLDVTAPHLLLSVRDEGVGMDAATMTRAFEPFFTTKPVGSGTGLGLATVYGIVERAHGAVWIDSAPGAGTTVSIVLPRFAPDAPAEAPDPVAVAATPVAGVVLLVEDQDAVRAMTRRMLERAGFAVTEAADGRQALDRLAELRDRGQPLTAIVTDLVMPDMGGAALEAHVRRTDPALPVVFISGYSAGDAIPDGTDRIVVEKPFTAEQLVAAIRQVAATRHVAVV